MAAIAANASFRNKEKRFLLPLTMASNVAFFCGLFGFVYAWFGIADARVLAYGLIAAMLVTFGLLTWGLARLQNVIRGRA